MREIKFEYGFEPINGVTYRAPVRLTLREVEKLNIYNEDLMRVRYRRQYTGLKDKTGKEIYEGDIVKNYGHIAWVEFKEGCFCWASNERGANNNELYISYVKFDKNIGPWEIIGNIYSNPELIKDK